MKKPDNPKERNLLKGAIRRLFSRSDLRRTVVNSSTVEHTDANRPRVKRWSKCPECRELTPTYLMEVDHIKPIISTNERLEDLSWDELVARIWCDIDNLKAICKTCHKAKTKAENKERRRLKNEKRKT